MAETEAKTTPPEAKTSPPKAKGRPPEAPGEETAPSRRKVPGRQRRYSFFEDGNDYVLLAVEQGEDGKAVPNGSLRPVPDVPRFGSATEGKRWVQTQGDKLAGLTVLVVKLVQKMQVLVENKPAVKVHEDVRFQREE